MPKGQSKTSKLNSELKQMNVDQLNKKLDDFRKEYMELRIQRVTAGRVGQQYNRLSDVQKDIARVLTQIRALQIYDLKAKYTEKKHVPKCLLKVTTRASRRALTTKQQNLLTKKAYGRRVNLPKIKFALRN